VFEDDHSVRRAGPSGRPAGRELEFDGLRALAAGMVLLFHCLYAVGMPNDLSAGLRRGPVGAIANGASAVVLFFLVSGHVLAGSFLRDLSRGHPTRGAAAFVVRRLFRLYPAYLAALAVAWLAALAHPHLGYGAGVGRAVALSAGVHLGAVELLRSALAPGTAYGLLPPGWTLTIELLLSFVLPLLVLLALRAGVSVLVVTAALGLLLTDLRAVQFGFPFALGIAIRMAGDSVPLRVRPRFGRLRLAAFWVAVAVLLLPPSWLWPVSPALGIATASLGAAGVVVLLPDRTSIAALLRCKPLVRIGEASYGLYLFHYSVLCLLVPVVLGDQPAADATTAIGRWLTLVALVLPVSLLVALASYRWIEAPAIAAGRRVSRNLTAGPRDAADPLR